MYLNCHTYFSFKYGTLSPEELFSAAKEKGVHKIILTDINNTSCWVEFARICEERQDEHRLEFGVGIEFRKDNELLYIGIAQNNNGFEELTRFLSFHECKNIPLPSTAPAFEHCYIIYPLKKSHPISLAEHEFIGIRASELNKLFLSPWRSKQDKLVILHPITFKDKKGYNLHRLLRAVDQNTLLSKLSPQDFCEQDEWMLPEKELIHHFRHYPQIVKTTLKVLNDSRITYKLGESKNKKNFYESSVKDHNELRRLTFEGINKRYGNNSEDAKKRADTELEIIAKLNFECYFLITHDLVKYATHRGFAHVGRGSGANSIVSFCLGLTDVDPLELDLYFERFLNPHRSSPPDFDIDFSWKDRDEIIDYILKKYGHDHASLLASFATFQGRAIIRELGKVFGLPKPEIDEIVDHPSKHENRDHITQLIFRYGALLKDFPKNLSIHAGGILISEEPLYKYTALNMPPKGFPTIHLDMYGAEDLGLYKYDILSQRGLGHIKDSIEIISENKHKEININNFNNFKKDSRLNEMLKTGNTIGCFYIESPAMRMLLSKLQCSDYPTLVAASSIIRPGVASSGMMQEYIYRHHHPEKFTYIHPVMEKLMKETYGVMVYQEDVIKVAHHFAGLSLADADVLRRGMSGKYRNRREFQKVEQAFFNNCREKAYPNKITQEVWRQIESFSGYSFSKAHSASYAVESYQSLFLKAYYPLEFMVAVINNFGGFYRTEFYVHEARKAGAEIEPPCVNQGQYLTSIRGKKIYLGFIHLKSLEAKIGETIAKERVLNGPYHDLYNFIQRIPLGIEQVSILIRIGAFRFTGKPKRTLLWEAFGYLGKGKPKSVNAELFPVASKNFELPRLETKPFEDAFDQLELLEFPLCNPFDLLHPSYTAKLKAKDLPKLTNKNIEIIGYLVTTKDTRTRSGIPMNFGTFLDPDGDFLDSVNFPDVARKYPFLGKGFYLLKGKVVMEFGFPMIETSYMQKLEMVNY